MATEDIGDVIRRNLVAFMKERGLSAPELHFLSSVPIGTIQKYMNGQRKPKAAPLHAIAEALGRATGDFYLENPPAPKPYRKPAFGLRILDEDVDQDLLQRAQEAIDALNVEYAARTKPKRQKTYVTDLEDEEDEVELPGRVAKQSINADAGGVAGDRGAGPAVRAVPPSVSPRARERSQKTRR